MDIRIFFRHAPLYLQYFYNRLVGRLAVKFYILKEND